MWTERAGPNLKSANLDLKFARDRVVQANDDLKSANDRERQRFSLAMDAIKLFHGEVSNDLLMKEKQFTNLRTKLLKGAADFYGRLEGLLKNQTDGESLRGPCQCLPGAGDNHRCDWRQSSGAGCATKGSGFAQGACLRAGAPVEYKLEVARSLLITGALQQILADPSGARAAYEEARRLAEKAKSHPSEAELPRGLLGMAWQSLGTLMSGTGDQTGAKTAYEKALAIRQELAREHPGEMQFQRRLAHLLTLYGAHSAIPATQPGRARPTTRHLRSIANWPTATPVARSFRCAHAYTQRSVGVLLADTGDPAGRGRRIARRSRFSAS